jgi:hypothetical protein
MNNSTQWRNQESLPDLVQNELSSRQIYANIKLSIRRGDERTAIKLLSGLDFGQSQDLWRFLRELATTEIDANHDSVTPILVKTLFDNGQLDPALDRLFAEHAMKALARARKVAI